MNKRSVLRIIIIFHNHMNLTIVLAQALGIILTVSGLSMLVSRKSIIALIDELNRSRGLLWLAGYVALVMGALIVALNNVWDYHLQLLITIIGWIAVIKGAVILLFPNFTVSLYKKMVTNAVITLSGLVTLILGLILLYKGFV